MQFLEMLLYSALDCVQRMATSEVQIFPHFLTHAFSYVICGQVGTAPYQCALTLQVQQHFVWISVIRFTAAYQCVQS